MQAENFRYVLIAVLAGALMSGCANPYAASTPATDPHWNSRITASQVERHNSNLGYSDNGRLTRRSVEPNVSSSQFAPINASRRFVRSYSGGDHWITKVADNGSIIILEDGSVWQVDAIDKIYSTLWLPLSNVTVVDDGFESKLINTDDDEIVMATQIR